MACIDCPDPSTCCGASEIALDSVISACMTSLGIQANRPISEAISHLADAICDLQEQVDTDITCSDMRVSGDYPNIGFEGTPTTTACDFFDALETRFGNILDWTGSLGCFSVSSEVNTITDALQDVIIRLCADLYTTDEEIFLPIAGNSDANLQQNIFMEAAQPIYWRDASGAQLTGFGSNTSLGMLLSGGLNGSSHLNPVQMESPVKLFFANRSDFSVLTAGTTNLDQDTMKPQYFIQKSTVAIVNLPRLSTLNITNPVVTFTATQFSQSVGNCKLYAFAGETIQGNATYIFGSDKDWVTLIGDASNWRVIAFGSF